MSKAIDPLKEFDKATREIARHTGRLKDATETRDQAAKDLYAAGEWPYRQLAERSTKLGVPLGLPRMAQIVRGRPERKKR